jgi:integrase
MPRIRFAFSATRLQQVTPPNRGAIYVYDTAAAGLAMRVTKAGARTFVLYRRIRGRPTRITLGPITGMTIPDARRAVQRILGQVAAGIDVAAERRQARLRGRTIAEVFGVWLSLAQRQKRSWRDDKRLWEIWLVGPLGRRPIAEVTTPELERLIQQIGRTHPRTANKCRSLLGTVWNHAIRRGEASTNPVPQVQRFQERSRDRFLVDHELEQFLRSVAIEHPTWRDYFLTALLTGQRRENISMMRWDELDLGNGVWHIPGTKAKNGRPSAIPLTDLAVGLLRRRKSEATGQWVFPSASGSKAGCVREPRKPWQRILKRAGIADLRVHDLRRSVGSWLGASGANSYVIARALGHRSPRSGEPYVRLAADPVRNALDSVQRARPLLDRVVRRATEGGAPHAS